jgi:oligopeptide/dipeptide ABC transporter ATP-binding protein
LTGIPGRAPSLEEGRPPGCPFHPRCKRAEPGCREEFPPERITGTGHKYRCILEKGK